MTDENTALYFADGRAFGATHAAPALTDAPEVGRMSASLAAIERAETLASDLAHERAAHQLTVLELTAAREEAGVTLQAAQAEIVRLTSVIADLRYVAGGQLEELKRLHESRDTECCNAAAEIADLKARLLGMTACAVDAGRDRDAALVSEGVALARLRKAEGIQPALARLAETVTGRPYPEVRAELDAHVAAHPGADPEGDETLVIDDPDAIERVTPEEIAAALKAHREQAHVAGAPFVALGDLVADLLAVTREIEAIERVAFGSETAGELRATSRRIEPLLVRQDTIERALARAVKP